MRACSACWPGARPRTTASRCGSRGLGQRLSACLPVGRGIATHSHLPPGRLLYGTIETGTSSLATLTEALRHELRQLGQAPEAPTAPTAASDGGDNELPSGPEAEQAATRIQAGFRGMKARKSAKQRRSAARVAAMSEDEAAVRIQAGFHGMKARRALRDQRRNRLAEIAAAMGPVVLAREGVPRSAEPESDLDEGEATRPVGSVVRERMRSFKKVVQERLLDPPADAPAVGKLGLERTSSFKVAAGAEMEPVRKPLLSEEAKREKAAAVLGQWSAVAKANFEDRVKNNSTSKPKTCVQRPRACRGALTALGPQHGRGGTDVQFCGRRRDGRSQGRFPRQGTGECPARRGGEAAAHEVAERQALRDQVAAQQ